MKRSRCMRSRCWREYAQNQNPKLVLAPCQKSFVESLQKKKKKKKTTIERLHQHCQHASFDAPSPRDQKDHSRSAVSCNSSPLASFEAVRSKARDCYLLKYGLGRGDFRRAVYARDPYILSMESEAWMLVGCLLSQSAEGRRAGV